MSLPVLDIFEIFFGITGIIFWTLIAYFVQRKYYSNFKRSFWLAFGGKMLGVLGFVFIFLFYYKGGDTIAYFNGAKQKALLLIDDPGLYYDYFTMSVQELKSFHPDVYYNLVYRGAEEEFMIKILSIFSLFGLNAYLLTSIHVAAVSFFALIFFYKTVVQQLKIKDDWFLIGVLLFPQVLFWGSGILRDTLALLGFYVFVAMTVKMLNAPMRFKYYMVFILSAYLTYNLKSYVLIAWLPCMAVGVYFTIKSYIKDVFLRFAVPILFLGVISVGMFLMLQSLANATQKYQLENLEGRVKGFHSWHTHQGGSVYDLGEVEYTGLGIVKKIPQALNVTFFRPYLWEASNVVVLLGALEALFLSFLFIRMLYFLFKFKVRLFYIFNIYPIIGMAFFYAMVFGFIVGFTSYNFGALARYKMPCVPMFVILTTFVPYYIKNKLKSRS